MIKIFAFYSWAIRPKGLYVLLLIALVLSLFFPASTMAATDFVADSGVYDLVGDSINAHSDAVYLWQHGGYIFVAISSSMNDKQLGAVTVNGEEPEELYWRDTLTVKNADDTEGDPFIENEDPPAKTATSYRWLIAKVEIEISEEIVLNVGGPGGHALVNVFYTVQGALNVFHEYPPDDPFQDFDQSVPSNIIGGLAADKYLVEPENPLKVGYEYSSVAVKIDGTELLSVNAGANGNANFAHGTVAIDSPGFVTDDLTSTSDKIFDFAKIDYTLSLGVAPSGSGVVTGAGSYNSGAVVPVTATANVGWKFVNWTEGATVVSTAPNFDYTMPARNVTLTANFEQIPFDGEWVEETAWANGPRYTPRGNWATYTPYVANSTVILYAGQHMEAGTVHFSASTDGKVTITITLANGWRFEDVKENVKIQDYSVAPKGNPAPGRFVYKANATGMSFNMDVAYNNFYGVHVNVEWLK